jgi:hypothetical protein
VKALNEVNYISMFATAKALEMTIGKDTKGRGFIGMKRTGAHVPGAGPLKLDTGTLND